MRFGDETETGNAETAKQFSRKNTGVHRRASLGPSEKTPEDYHRDRQLVLRVKDPERTAAKIENL